MLKVWRTVYFQSCRQIKAKTPFAPVFYDISKSTVDNVLQLARKISPVISGTFYNKEFLYKVLFLVHPIFQKVVESPTHFDIFKDTSR